MPDSIITLTTDFGTESPYVAAVKGVILEINHQARLIDLSHQIPPQDLRHTAYFLAAALPYFPAGAIHLIVVDPGVGTTRALLYVEVEGRRLLVPDNGCWTRLVHSGRRPVVIQLQDAHYWRQPVSATFHGRDILAPVAGWLSRGLDPAMLGPRANDWVKIVDPVPQLAVDSLAGEVIFVDHFGNLITNITGEVFAAFAKPLVRISVGGQEVTHQVRSYADGERGALVALISSSGQLEVAVNQGSAAQYLQVGVGAPILVERVRSQ